MHHKVCPTCNVSYPAHLERCPEDNSPLQSRNKPDLKWAAGKLVAGRYVVFADTGSNGVSSTYRVRSLDLDEVRSLKALQPDFSSDRAAADEFRRTVRLLRKVHH